MTKTTVEEFITNQETSRTHHLYKTTNRYKQNDFIRNHLAQILLNKFGWNYWVTLTFGYQPYMDEVEDLLYKLHHRIDHRILCHSGRNIMYEEERSEWVMFPEVGSQGLHYHGFIRLGLNPTLRDGYKSEWDWMRTAFDQTLSKMNGMISTLDGRKLERGFKLVGRSVRGLDNLKMIIYSMKEYGREDFDRFNYTIFSTPDWKPSLLNRRRQQKKFSSIPQRPNKIQTEGSLLNFFGDS